MASVEYRQVTKTFEEGSSAVKGLSLAVNSGEFLVLLGPSGCGKSTALRLLAGLEDPDSGDIFIDGIRVNDLPPGARQVGMVFQSYALYPHKTVRDNLLFGLKHGVNSGQVTAAEMQQRVDEAVSLLDLKPLLDRLPKDLSGGQQQRVAIGRALVKRPKVLLMDEPLSNLDAKLRSRMRFELRRLHEHHGTTTVYVTHDQMEAMTLADRIAILSAGELQQQGRPMDVYGEPANAFIASFLGTPPMNLVRGRAADGWFEAPGLRFKLPDHLSASTGPGTYGVRPEHLEFFAAQGQGEAAAQGQAAAQSQVTVQLAGLEHLGNEMILHVQLGDDWIRLSDRVSADRIQGRFQIGDMLTLEMAAPTARFFAEDNPPAEDSPQDSPQIEREGAT